MKNQHILAIRLSAMGDVAMVVPVLRLVTSQHPDLKITVLTQNIYAAFFKNIPNVSVLGVDKKGAHKGLLGLYKLSKTIKLQKIDAVADLHNVLRSKTLSYLLPKIPFEIIDKGRKEKKALTSGKIFQPLKTTHQRYFSVFEKLGFPIKEGPIVFPKALPLSDKLKQFFINQNKKTIGIAPFAAHKAKMYPLEKMELVIDSLSKSYNIILFGSKTEAPLLNKWIVNFENVASVAGKLSLTEELQIMAHLHLMLSMDSGNAHIAAMLGVKVLTIWGVTHPYAGFAPYNQPEDYALLADRNKYPLVPTSVYGNKYPKGYEKAIETVSVNHIIEKVIQVLKE